MDDFGQLDRPNMYTFGDSFYLEVGKNIIAYEVSVFDDFLNGDVKKVFVFVSLDEREKLERFVWGYE